MGMRPSASRCAPRRGRGLIGNNGSDADRCTTYLPGGMCPRSDYEYPYGFPAIQRRSSRCSHCPSCEGLQGCSRGYAAGHQGPRGGKDDEEKEDEGEEEDEGEGEDEDEDEDVDEEEAKAEIQRMEEELQRMEEDEEEEDEDGEYEYEEEDEEEEEEGSSGSGGKRADRAEALEKDFGSAGGVKDILSQGSKRADAAREAKAMTPAAIRAQKAGAYNRSLFSST